jgi:hypothetical protein
VYNKRLAACLLGGGISALVCLIGAQIIHGNPPISWETVSYTMANRVLLGFIIGLSAWQLYYLVHGALLGLIVSLSVSIAFVARPMDFFLYTAAGVIYGVFIEFLSTRIFRAPMMRPYAP